MSPLADAALTAIGRAVPAIGILLVNLPAIDIENLSEAVEEVIEAAAADAADAADAEVAAWPWRIWSTRDGDIARWRGVNPANEYQAYFAEVIDQDGDDSVFEIRNSRSGEMICQGGAPDFDSAMVLATGQLRDFVRADPDWTVNEPGTEALDVSITCGHPDAFVSVNVEPPTIFDTSIPFADLVEAFRDGCSGEGALYEDCAYWSDVAFVSLLKAPAAVRANAITTARNLGLSWAKTRANIIESGGTIQPPPCAIVEMHTPGGRVAIVGGAKFIARAPIGILGEVVTMAWSATSDT